MYLRRKALTSETTSENKFPTGAAAVSWNDRYNSTATSTASVREYCYIHRAVDFNSFLTCLHTNC